MGLSKHFTEFRALEGWRMFQRFSSRKSEDERRLAADVELLHNSPFLDSVWYRQAYADLRNTPIDAARHYLEYGAREGRNPHPQFDTKWYLRQNPDVAASGMNPLVHYILHGQKEGRLPCPTDSSAETADRPAFLLSTEPTANSNAAATIPEPEIKPPPLIAGTKLSASEICRRNAQIAAAVRSLQGRSDHPDAILSSECAALARAKLRLLGTADMLSGAALNEGMQELLETTGAIGLQDTIIGIGITPERTVTEDDVLAYDVPILRRYNSGRLEAARRFELEPARASSTTSGPTISLLVPVYKTPVVFLERAILSVLFQTYANWELILVDDFSQRSDIEAALKYYGTVDSRVKVYFRIKNGGISATTNDALAAADGDYVGLLDHDDMLTRDALEKVAERLSDEPTLDFVYTDECKIDRYNVPDDLFHKPDWSPLLLLNFMYTGHFSVYRKSLVESVGGFRSKYDFSQDYDLALRIAERQPKVAHVDQCLYGWRMIPGSGASGDRPDARVSNIAALQDAVNRRGYDGVAVALPTANRVKRAVPVERPLVSIVIPSDSYSNIWTTVESIVSNSSYSDYEILVVTNSGLIAFIGNQLGPATRFVPYDKPYNFSDKCNQGAAQARGEYVVFYNDDVRVISPDWIENLLEYLTLPQVGAVGPKLIYENGTIQHAGMVTGVRRLLGTAFHAYPENTIAYFNLAQSVREVSILSGACLAMPMKVFCEVGGFDNDNTPIAHSDVDICFRVQEIGKCCVYTPHAQLTHIGHLSIGSVEAGNRKSAKPSQKNMADLFLLKKWGRHLEDDPYFPRKVKELVYIDSQESFSLRKGILRAKTKDRRNFVLFSHDLSASGAPQICFDIAKLLAMDGHYVLVISPEDGPFASRLLDSGVDVIVDPLALSNDSAIAGLARNFDAAICNTILCWRVPLQLHAYLPVYLYAHESQLVRHFAETIPSFCKGMSAATAVWGAGPLVVSAIRNHCGLEARNIEGSVDEPEHGINNKDDYHGATVIALIGTYESRKGQDIAIRGFNKFFGRTRVPTKLVMAGRTNDPEFRKSLLDLASGNSNIIFRDELTHSAVSDLMRRASIVLVPSRDDPLPLVSMEALSIGKIVVCSMTTGTASYIVDGDSGFILRENGPDEVCATLEKIFEQRQKWALIAANARGIYEAYFTPQRFKNRIFAELDLLTGEKKINRRPF